MHERAVRIFLLTACAIAVVPFIAAVTRDHLQVHAAINRYHAPWADGLFAYGTNLADGWIPTVIGLILLFVRWRWFLMLGVSTAGSALIAQFLKHTFFAAHDRPSMFLDAMPDLRLVPGVEVLHHNSFPSGHSACAFSMCFAAAVIIGRGWPSAALAIVAALLAFSRVYLSQHFTEDALCGALIGTVTGWLVYRWLYVSGFSRKAWLEGSLLRRQNQ